MTSESGGESPRARGLKAIRRAAVPVQIVLGLAAVALGAALFLAPIGIHGIAIVTGIGLAVIGAAMIVMAVRNDVPGGAVAPVIGGALLVLIGATMAVWPMRGAPWLAFLVGAALIVHGLVSVVAAVRGRGDQRITAIIAALATALVGVVAFAWPVLTLTIFRFAVAVWLVFLGLQLIFSLIVRRRRADSPGRAPAGSPARTTSVRARLRRWARTLRASVALVCAVLLVLGTASLMGGVALPEPGDFYTAPADVPDEPGQLIRSEPLTVGVPSGAEAWKILYTTTLPDGTPAVSSGTVLAPADRDGSPLPLLTVAHGTTGVVPKCAPSMSPTPFADGAGTAMQQMVTQHGWVAVTSDYVGLGTGGTHPYLIGEAEARNALDASRAAQQFDEITTTTDTVVWGHSQGGQASLWIGQVAGDYAPEFTIKGVAAFAPAANLFGLAEADKSNAGGKAVSAYIASTWDRIYPDLDLDQHLTPGSASGVERIRNLCFDGKDALGAILIGSQVPNQIFPDSVLEGAFGDRLKTQTPVGPWPAPVLVAQGLSDPLVLPSLQQDWVNDRCDAGEEIDYRTFPGLSHVSLVGPDSPLTPQIVQWTLDRWDGEPPTPNCGSTGHSS